MFDSTYQQEKDDGRRSPSGALRLRKLSGKHYRIINYHLEGMKGQEIALMMGMSQGQISLILNDPLVKEVIAKRFVDLDNETFARANQVVREKLEDKDPAIALRAADMAWRARGRYEKKSDDRPTAEDVVQRMLEVAARTGTAQLTVTTGQSLPRSVDPLTIEHDLK